MFWSPQVLYIEFDVAKTTLKNGITFEYFIDQIVLDAAKENGLFDEGIHKLKLRNKDESCYFSGRFRH